MGWRHFSVADGAVSNARRAVPSRLGDRCKRKWARGLDSPRTGRRARIAVSPGMGARCKTRTGFGSDHGRGASHLNDAGFLRMRLRRFERHVKPRRAMRSAVLGASGALISDKDMYSTVLGFLEELFLATDVGSESQEAKRPAVGR